MLDAARTRDLGDVVQRLAPVVPHARVLVGEGAEHRLQQLRQQLAHVLSQPDGGAGQGVKRALAQIGLGRLGQVGPELRDERRDLLVVVRVAQLAHEVLHLRRRCQARKAGSGLCEAVVHAPPAQPACASRTPCAQGCAASPSTARRAPACSRRLTSRTSLLLHALNSWQPTTESRSHFLP